MMRTLHPTTAGPLPTFEVFVHDRFVGRVIGEALETTDPTGVEDIAKCVHQALKAFRETEGDFAQLEWEDTPEEERSMTQEVVQYLVEHPDLVDLSASHVHDLWMKAKVADGWTYGGTRDFDRKTHPSLIPFGDLSHVEQVKDQIVLNMVQALRRPR